MLPLNTMKTLQASVVLLMFALLLLGITGCATHDPDSSGPIPWDRPDAGEPGGLPSTGSFVPQ